MKAKQLRGLLMQVVFNWTNNSKFKGSDTGGLPIVLKVAEGTKSKLIVEVKSGLASVEESDLYEVRVSVKKLGKR